MIYEDRRQTASSHYPSIDYRSYAAQLHLQGMLSGISMFDKIVLFHHIKGETFFLPNVRLKRHNSWM